jgi:hypothetical protein
MMGRSFHLPEADEQHLNGRGLRWETVAGRGNAEPLLDNPYLSQGDAA